MTNKINDGGSAFPGQHVTSYRAASTGGLHSPTFAITEPHSGMSLRDYFAGQALMGIGGEYSNLNDLAEDAYRLADAMLKARGDV